MYITSSYISFICIRLYVWSNSTSISGLCTCYYSIYILLFYLQVQHLIAEVSEIMTNDTVDKAGLWKNKLIDQSLELLDYLPQAIQDICFLKEIHMEMFKYLKLHIIIFCVHLSSLSNFESVSFSTMTI